MLWCSETVNLDISHHNVYLGFCFAREYFQDFFLFVVLPLSKELRFPVFVWMDVSRGLTQAALAAQKLDVEVVSDARSLIVNSAA